MGTWRGEGTVAGTYQIMHPLTRAVEAVSLKPKNSGMDRCAILMLNSSHFAQALLLRSGTTIFGFEAYTSKYRLPSNSSSGFLFN